MQNGLPGGPWASYTPTISSTGGSGLTATASGRFITIGKTVSLEMQITITGAGTGSGAVTATLPRAPTANFFVCAGRENQVTGKMLQGVIPTTAPMQIFFYDNTFPGATGNLMVVSCVYEAQ